MATMIGDESIEKVGDFWGGAGQPEGKTSAVGVELTTLHGAVLLDIAAEQSETVSNKMSV
jgi:hypothetical protein